MRTISTFLIIAMFIIKPAAALDLKYRNPADCRGNTTCESLTLCMNRYTEGAALVEAYMDLTDARERAFNHMNTAILILVNMQDSNDIKDLERSLSEYKQAKETHNEATAIFKKKMDEVELFKKHSKSN